jgi:hypothetical protein
MVLGHKGSVAIARRDVADPPACHRVGGLAPGQAVLGPRHSASTHST